MKMTTLSHEAPVLIEILNGFSVCIFFSLAIWLAIKGTDYSVNTWTESVLMGGNHIMMQQIAQTNTTMRNLCEKPLIVQEKSDHINTRLSLPLLLFSLDNTVVRGSVFCTVSPLTYNCKTLLLMVLILSFLFQVWRFLPVCTRLLPTKSSFIGWGLLDSQDKPLRNMPDFSRWLEYTVTSPMQIIVIAITVYIRNVHHLSLLSTLQGALTLSGWTVEVCISNLQIAATNSGKMSREFANTLMKLAAVFLAATYAHYVIWFSILDFYIAHENNTRNCDLGIKKIPEIIQTIVIVQCVLFSMFGGIPLLQIAVVLMAEPSKTTFIWHFAAIAYSILSVVSKGLLAFMFVKLLTDGNCVDTDTGKACLY